MIIYCIQNVIAEGGIQIPLAWVATVGGILAGAIATLFVMLIRTKDEAAKGIHTEKERRLSDAVEHERLVSELRERIASLKGGRDGGETRA